jgi:hypothetical protein
MSATPRSRRKKPTKHDRYIRSIPQAEYDALFEAQGGVCAVCGHPPKRYRLSLDHDHKTMALRGLLCHACNRLIGFARDNPERLRRAADYLEGSWDAP